jgi:hypothetical protein
VKNFGREDKIVCGGGAPNERMRNDVVRGDSGGSLRGKIQELHQLVR